MRILLGVVALLVALASNNLLEVVKADQETGDCVANSEGECINPDTVEAPIADEAATPEEPPPVVVEEPEEINEEIVVEEPQEINEEIVVEVPEESTEEIVEEIQAEEKGDGEATADEPEMIVAEPEETTEEVPETQPEEVAPDDTIEERKTMEEDPVVMVQAEAAPEGTPPVEATAPQPQEEAAAPEETPPAEEKVSEPPEEEAAPEETPPAEEIVTEPPKEAAAPEETPPAEEIVPEPPEEEAAPEETPPAEEKVTEPPEEPPAAKELLNTPGCPSRAHVIQCAQKHLDTNGNHYLERAELQAAVDRLPWISRGILVILGSVDRMIERCDVDKDGAIGIDYDMKHNGELCLASCFKRRAFKAAFFPDCSV